MDNENWFPLSSRKTVDECFKLTLLHLPLSSHITPPGPSKNSGLVNVLTDYTSRSYSLGTSDLSFLVLSLPVCRTCLIFNTFLSVSSTIFRYDLTDGAYLCPRTRSCRPWRPTSRVSKDNIDDFSKTSHVPRSSWVRTLYYTSLRAPADLLVHTSRKVVLWGDWIQGRIGHGRGSDPPVWEVRGGR